MKRTRIKQTPIQRRALAVLLLAQRRYMKAPPEDRARLRRAMQKAARIAHRHDAIRVWKIEDDDKPRLRKLTKEDVIFTVHISEEDIPIKGNALASGDNAADKACEDAIITELNAGNLWAWCCVEVRATWNGHSASDTLGCCSYEDEKAFLTDGYYEDMCKTALERLNDDLVATLESLPLE